MEDSVWISFVSVRCVSQVLWDSENDLIAVTEKHALKIFEDATNAAVSSRLQSSLLQTADCAFREIRAKGGKPCQANDPAWSFPTVTKPPNRKSRDMSKRCPRLSLKLQDGLGPLLRVAFAIALRHPVCLRSCKKKFEKEINSEWNDFKERFYWELAVVCSKSVDRESKLQASAAILKPLSPSARKLRILRAFAISIPFQFQGVSRLLRSTATDLRQMLQEFSSTYSQLWCPAAQLLDSEDCQIVDFKISKTQRLDSCT